MTERWLVIGDDARMQILAKRLANNHFDVYWHRTTSWGETENNIIQSFSPTKLILPVQPLSLDVSKVGIELFTTTFVGKLNVEWQQQLTDVLKKHYLEHEQFMWQNAILTAEAIIAILHKEQMPIYDQRIYITGFGRIAKMLAKRLHVLQSHVIIGTFNEIELAEALAYGYQAHLIKEDIDINCEIVINTIPFNWLTAKYERLLNVRIYDIASIPCMDIENIKSNYYQILPSLPARFFPEAAADVLYKTILLLAKEA